MSENILQVTKNDAVSLITIGAYGDVGFAGEISSPTLKKMAGKMNVCKGSDRLLTDVLNINFNDPDNEANYYGVIGTEDASTLINSPVTSGAFYAYREVLTIKSPRQNYKTIVRLTEAYPVPGRLWIRVYNPDIASWSSWKFLNQSLKAVSYSSTVPANTGGVNIPFTIPEGYSTFAITNVHMTGVEGFCNLQRVENGMINVFVVVTNRKADIMNVEATVIYQ